MSNNLENNQISLISTLPKSGTWYLLTFFWCYDQIIKNMDAYLEGTFKPDLAEALRAKKINERDTLEPLEGLFIYHSVCHGFQNINDPRYAQWEMLHFPFPYSWADSLVQERIPLDLLSPLNNPKVRIVYIYRNPLDHFVSYYQFGQKHKNDIHRLKVLPDRTLAPVKDLHDFVFEFGILGAFIKHYYPFKQMHQLFPENVLLMSYEDLITNPHAAFHKILSFVNLEPDNQIKQHIVEDALGMCSKDALMAIESTFADSINGEMMNNGKHLQGGEIGKWKAHFSQNELESIENTLNTFDISLRDFTLSPNESTLTSLPWLADAKEKNQSARFLTQQFNGQSNKIIELNAQLEELTTQGQSLKTKLEQAENRIHTFESSYSWRITSPVRLINRFVRRSLNL